MWLTSRNLWIAVAAAGLIASLAACAGTAGDEAADSQTTTVQESPAPISPPPPPATEPSTSEPSVAEQLATIQRDGPVDSGDPLVAKFRKVLAALKTKCKEPRTRLADFAVNSRQILSDAGIEETLLSIMRNVNASIPKALGRTRCADIFTAYVLIRRGG